LFDKKAYNKRYYIKNREKILEYGKQYRINNWEKENERKKQWRKNNPEYKKQYYRDKIDKIKKQGKQYYSKNREEIYQKTKEYKKKWTKNNPNYYYQYRKQWKKDNPKYYKKYFKNKRKTDLRYIFNHRMTTAISLSLKGNKAGRHWEVMVGYSCNDLIERLKQTIPKGYTWDDFLEGKLHIDHIIPKSVFNFTKPEHNDFKRCWALSNLQLLPARENLIKYNKLSKPFQPALAI